MKPKAYALPISLLAGSQRNLWYHSAGRNSRKTLQLYISIHLFLESRFILMAVYSSKNIDLSALLLPVAPAPYYLIPRSPSLAQGTPLVWGTPVVQGPANIPRSPNSTQQDSANTVSFETAYREWKALCKAVADINSWAALREQRKQCWESVQRRLHNEGLL